MAHLKFNGTSVIHNIYVSLTFPNSKRPNWNDIGITNKVFSHTYSFLEIKSSRAPIFNAIKIKRSQYRNPHIYSIYRSQNTRTHTSLVNPGRNVPRRFERAVNKAKLLALSAPYRSMQMRSILHVFHDA